MIEEESQKVHQSAESFIEALNNPSIDELIAELEQFISLLSPPPATSHLVIDLPQPDFTQTLLPSESPVPSQQDLQTNNAIDSLQEENKEETPADDVLMLEAAPTV